MPGRLLALKEILQVPISVFSPFAGRPTARQQWPQQRRTPERPIRRILFPAREWSGAAAGPAARRAYVHRRWEAAVFPFAASAAMARGTWQGRQPAGQRPHWPIPEAIPAIRISIPIPQTARITMHENAAPKAPARRLEWLLVFFWRLFIKSTPLFGFVQAYAFRSPFMAKKWPQEKSCGHGAVFISSCPSWHGQRLWLPRAPWQPPFRRSRWSRWTTWPAPSEPGRRWSR